MGLQWSNELKLTPTELSVYHFLRSNRPAIPFMSVREIASECHVSPSTVMRLVKKLNYSSFFELKNDIRDTSTTLGIDQTDSVWGIPDFLSSGIFLSNFQDNVNKATQLILDSSQIICIGLGSSSIIAEYTCRQLNTIGIHSFYTNESYSPIFKQMNMGSTALLIFSVSGETRELIELCSRISQSDAKVITVTNGNNNTLTNFSLCSIPYFTKRQKIASGSDFTSQIPPMFVAETILKNVYLSSTNDSIQ